MVLTVNLTVYVTQTFTFEQTNPVLTQQRSCCKRGKQSEMLYHQLESAELTVNNSPREQKIYRHEK